MLFDSHTHLNDDLLYPKLQKVLEASFQNDVSTMVCIGYDKPSSLRAIDIAEKNEHVYCAIGFHPTEAVNIREEDFHWLEETLSHPKVVAIGEIGLDYYWDATHKDIQKKVFIRQIQLASKYHLPISVHMRDSLEDTLHILQTEKKQSDRGIMHCFSGSLESAKEFIKANMMISLAGPVTFKNARVPKEVAKGIDIQNLLIETDAPYLTPHPHRGKENSPAFLHLIAKEIARIKELPYIDVAAITTKNALDIFQL